MINTSHLLRLLPVVSGAGSDSGVDVADRAEEVEGAAVPVRSGSCNPELPCTNSCCPDGAACPEGPPVGCDFFEPGPAMSDL